jgi:hypothetical protein
MRAQGPGPVDDGGEAGRPDPGAAPDPAAQPQAPPDLEESLRQVGAAGRASWHAASDIGKALRSLVAADFSLARSAFGRTLAFTGVAIVFGASTWLLLMTALIVALNRQLGWPWWAALLSCAALSGIGAAVAVRQGMRYFEHTRMQATRRQLARLGIGELSDFAPPAGSAQSTRDVAERVASVAEEGALKDRRGVDVTPP